MQSKIFEKTNVIGRSAEEDEGEEEEAGDVLRWYDGGGDRTERSAIKATQYPAKLCNATHNFTTEASLLAEAALQQLHISRTGSLYLIDMGKLLCFEFPLPNCFLPPKRNSKSLTLAVGSDYLVIRDKI